MIATYSIDVQDGFEDGEVSYHIIEVRTNAIIVYKNPEKGKEAEIVA